MKRHKGIVDNLIRAKSNKPNLPIKVLVLYIVLTLCLYLFGPLEYRHTSKIHATIFMIVFLIGCVSFYIVGSKVPIKMPRKSLPIDTKRIIQFAIIYSFAMQLLLVVQNSIVQGISLTKLFQSNLLVLMAESYTDVEARYTLAAWVLSYTGWVKIVALVGGSYYGFTTKSSIYRILYFGLILLIVVNIVLFIGALKLLVDLIPYVLVPCFIRRVRMKKRISIKRVLLIIIVFILIFLSLGVALQSRRDLWSIRYNSSNNFLIADLNRSNWLYTILPGIIAPLTTQMIFYTSQGYHGLSLCLQLPFQFSWGMGFSFKIMNDISKWFGIPLSQLENSYPVRMQESFGVKAYALWHTVFPWWASDLTWLGALFVVWMFIYYWAKAWREVIKFNSLPALLLFAHISLFVMYIPNNNQLFQTRDSIVSTIIIALVWYLFHGRKEYNEAI